MGATLNMSEEIPDDTKINLVAGALRGIHFFQGGPS
jgi:hypothetical protein